MWNFLKRYLMPIYVSPLDQFLQRFDASHRPTAVQLREMEKYRRLNQLRDETQAQH